MALHEGVPSVAASGAVALWHRGCWERRSEPMPIAPAPEEPRPSLVRAGAGWLRARAASRAVRRGAAALAIGLAGALVAAQIASLVSSMMPPEPLAPPALALTTRERLKIRSALASRDDAAPFVQRHLKRLQASDEVPLVDGVPLDELFPSLRGWAHPVTASSEYMPEFPPRQFGSERHGIERPECGAGHCGVDLDGPRGRPIVAVAAGTVVRVERRELGADGRSGRYVRLQHDDGTFTAYMHLDAVAEGLGVGSAVARGQYLGTLGASAVFSAPPHCHFSLEIPNKELRDARGDHTATRYVNPAPFLMRSQILPVFERPARPALN